VNQRAEPSAVARNEQLLAVATILFRLGGLSGLVLGAAFDYRHFHGAHALLTIAMLCALTAQSTVLTAVCLTRRRVPARWAAADLAITLAALATGMTVTRYLFNIYPYSVTSSVAYGIAFRRVPSMLAVITLLAGTDLTSTLALHREMLGNAIFDAGTYVPNVLVAYIVSAQMRRTAAALDASRAQVAQLAAEKERLRHVRVLHDRILQTMELLAGSDWIPDPTRRAHVAADAAWLRSFVTGHVDGGGNLLAQLQALADDKRRTGLRVDFHHHSLDYNALHISDLPADVVDAVAGAVGEALTNVAKHAGVERAVLRATLTDHTLTVSILDNGAGFDPATARRGLGLDQSITARVREAGGQVRIESSPGQGTYVEIVISCGKQHHPDRHRR
jgi:signal transduction histidine kinase